MESWVSRLLGAPRLLSTASSPRAGLVGRSSAGDGILVMAMEYGDGENSWVVGHEAASVVYGSRGTTAGQGKWKVDSNERMLETI